MANRGMGSGDIYLKGKALQVSQQVAHQISLRAAEIIRRTAPRGINNSRRLIRATWQKGQIGVHIPPQAIHLLYLDQGIKPFIMNSLEGKAQPLDEPILTPAGWSTMGNLSVGDAVFGSDGMPTKVNGIFPQGNQKCYRVEFYDGTHVRCSADHLWEVSRRTMDGSPKTMVVTTEYLIPRIHMYSWQIRTHAPLEFPHNYLPIHPYILGVLLGDGHFGSSPVVSDESGVVIDTLKSFLPKGMRVTKNKKYEGAGQSWTLSMGNKGWNVGLDIEVRPGKSKNWEWQEDNGNPINAGIRKLGLWGVRDRSKFIPSEYFLSPSEDRLLLLQGLMDSDGNCQEPCYPGFFSTSKHLAYGVADLVRSLGGISSVSTEKRSKEPKNGLGWRVTLVLPEGIVPFRANLGLRLERYQRNFHLRETGFKKRIKDIVSDGEEEMQCISVESDDSLYVTNGYTLTHNTIPIRGPGGAISFRRAKNVGSPQILARNERGQINYTKLSWRYPGVEAMNFIQPALAQAAKEYFESLSTSDMVDELKDSPGEIGKFFSRFKKESIL